MVFELGLMNHSWRRRKISAKMDDQIEFFNDAKCESIVG